MEEQRLTRGRGLCEGALLASLHPLCTSPVGSCLCNSKPLPRPTERVAKPPYCIFWWWLSHVNHAPGTDGGQSKIPPFAGLRHDGPEHNNNSNSNNNNLGSERRSSNFGLTRKVISSSSRRYAPIFIRASGEHQHMQSVDAGTGAGSGAGVGMGRAPAHCARFRTW